MCGKRIPFLRTWRVYGFPLTVPPSDCQQLYTVLVLNCDFCPDSASSRSLISAFRKPENQVWQMSGGAPKYLKKYMLASAADEPDDTENGWAWQGYDYGTVIALVFVPEAGLSCIDARRSIQGRKILVVVLWCGFFLASTLSGRQNGNLGWMNI